MTNERNGEDLDEHRVRGVVSPSVAGHKPAASGERPNFALRRTLLAAGLGFAGVTGFFGVRALLNAHNQDALNTELSQPIPKVEAEIRSGQINSDDVTRFKVGDTEYAWTVASDLTKDGHAEDTPVVSSIIEDQQGNPVQGGSEVILPGSEVDTLK